MTSQQSISIYPIHSLTDNYIWAIVDNEKKLAVIIDPGDAKPALKFLQEQDLMLSAILITHHHWDHTNGIDDLLKIYPVKVFGPATENISTVTNPVRDGMQIKLDPLTVTMKVISIPGHTSGHVAYYGAGMLFSGDTLFGAGCGRLFEGSPEQMVASLNKLTALPDDTKLYCAHEYTLQNLLFAETVEPGNQKIQERIQTVLLLREKLMPSLPSTLGEEKKTNPFLRCDSPELISHVEKHAGCSLKNYINVFAKLREWKNSFK